ncbi:MAG: hypothetical protein QM689_03365 [Oscillospiraceae bacterium]
MSDYNRYITVTTDGWENNAYAPKSDPKSAEAENQDGELTPCWKIDSRGGKWTSVVSQIENASAGEKIRLAFWAKFAYMGSAFWLEINPEDWEKRTTWMMNQETSLLAAQKGAYYLFVADYEVVDACTLTFSLSANDFEVEIFPATETEATMNSAHPIPEISENAVILDYKAPFSGFSHLDFINCFSSVYMFLKGITGDVNSTCKTHEGQPCDGCGNCRKTPAGIQEQLYFWFDTMSGRSALRCRFDGQPTEMQLWIGEAGGLDCGTADTVDFLFGLAGYCYRRVEDSTAFCAEIAASIDAGKPVIASVKSCSGRFRVITGYDSDRFLYPSFVNAQNIPYGAQSYDKPEYLYIIGDKIPPRYTLKDGLDRIIQVMEYNLREKLWDGYMEKMGLYTADSLGKASLDEKKARMKRVADTMWETFNCHNFAEVFRGRFFDEALCNPAFDALWNTIDKSYGYTHDLAWALIGLEQCADWTTHPAGYFGEMVELTLMQLAKNDAAVLEAVKSAREILTGK